MGKLDGIFSWKNDAYGESLKPMETKIHEIEELLKTNVKEKAN